MAKKLSLRPAQRTEVQELESFISGANNDSPKNEGSNEPKPWDNPRVREDVIKAVSLRLPEPYIIKLQYLSDKTNLSQQEILRRVVLPWIDAEVEKY